MLPQRLLRRMVTLAEAGRTETSPGLEEQIRRTEAELRSAHEECSEAWSCFLAAPPQARTPAGDRYAQALKRVDDLTHALDSLRMAHAAEQQAEG